MSADLEPRPQCPRCNNDNSRDSRVTAASAAAADRLENATHGRALAVNGSAVTTKSGYHVCPMVRLPGSTTINALSCNIP